MAISHQERLKRLHSLGLLSDMKANRKNYTDSEKQRIQRQWKTWHEIAEVPKEFKKVNIAHLGPRTREYLTKAGYKIHNDTAFVPLQKAKSAGIKTVSVKDATGKPEVVAQVTRKFSDRKIEKELVGKPLTNMSLRDRLFEEYRRGKMKKGDYIGIKSYDKGVWRRHFLTNFNDALRVIYGYQTGENKFKEAKNQDEVNDIIDHTHLVILSVKDMADLEAGLKERNDYSRTSRKRRKSRSKIGGAYRRARYK